MQQPALIGDIGGTNARFALTDLAADKPQILHEHTFSDATRQEGVEMETRWVVPPRGGFSPHPPTPLTQPPGELGLEEGFS